MRMDRQTSSSKTVHHLASLVLTLAMAAWSAVANAAGLAIPGTGACEAALKELAAQLAPGRIEVPPSVGSGGGIKAVRAGQATVARVSRTLTDEERAAGLRYQPFALDAAVFVAGTGAGVKRITSAQARDIFSGRLRRWSEVGGADAAIRVVTRESSDAAFSALRDAFAPFAEARPFDGAKLAMRDSENVDLLARFGASIGVSARAALHRLGDRVVVLAVDGREPSAEAVRARTYPAVLEHAFVWKGSLHGEADAFMKAIRSPAGVTILAAHGLLPATE